MNENEITYTDNSGVRYFRHRPEPVRSFALRVNIGDRVRDLVLQTPDGHHEFDLVVEAHRNGAMEPVQR